MNQGSRNTPTDLGSYRKPITTGESEAPAAPERLPIQKIEVTEEGQVVTLNLKESSHFRITAMGSFNFTLNMPAGGFDGQLFTVEVKGKPITSWNDDAVDCLMTFHQNWMGRGANTMMIQGASKLQYNRDFYFPLVQADGDLMQIKVQNHLSTYPHWILDSIVLDEFMVADYDSEPTYEQGVLIKEVMNVYTLSQYVNGELVYPMYWD